jgi:hypothetical protein
MVTMKKLAFVVMVLVGSCKQPGKGSYFAKPGHYTNSQPQPFVAPPPPDKEGPDVA